MGLEITVRRKFLSDHSPVFDIVLKNGDGQIEIPMDNRWDAEAVADELASGLRDTSVENVYRKNEF